MNISKLTNTSVDELLRFDDCFELHMRQAHLHYPSVILIKNGSIISTIKYGYETKEQYEKEFLSLGF